MTAGRRLRVALVAHDVHDEGGAERAIAELIRRGSSEVDFTVLSSTLAPELRPLVEWVRVRAPRRPFPLRFVVFYALAGWRLRRVEADLVHALGALVPNRVDVVSVQFCHHAYRARTGDLAAPGLKGLRRVGRSVTRLLGLAAERWSYRPARLRSLAAAAPGGVDDLRAFFPDVAIAVTPNGVALERQTPGGALPSRTDEDIVVVFVGSDFERKGLAIAIEAVARVREQTGASIRLWVVGGGSRAPYEHLLAARGLLDTSVEFFGARPDVATFYERADVFLLPTLYETFCIAAYEAALTGSPVIATPVPGIADLVGSGEAGILIERSVDSAAHALRRMVEDPALRETLGDAAARRAARYTWDASAQSVLRLYEELTAPAPALPETADPAAHAR